MYGLTAIASALVPATTSRSPASTGPIQLIGSFFFFSFSHRGSWVTQATRPSARWIAASLLVGVEHEHPVAGDPGRIGGGDVAFPQSPAGRAGRATIIRPPTLPA